jgi:hypothetical protein
MIHEPAVRAFSAARHPAGRRHRRGWRWLAEFDSRKLLTVLARQGTPWAAEIPDDVEIVLTPLPGQFGMTWFGTLDGRPFCCL